MASFLVAAGFLKKVIGGDRDWAAPCRRDVLWCKPLNDSCGLALLVTVGSGGHFSGTAHFLRHGYSV
ncbi:TPA: hypothetical protein MI992_18515 [Klebsiella pneumoniae]|nr:hypothetical protein [Klebsiella pneumoniae]HBY9455071.1 hypothetical protein [Klebsiella pneumoniae]HBY9556816.1 hypothetical protein [Klebsiella pneumoniae]HBY9700472.1 hypothetical protein [Klebsiella pneumoniae]HBY9706153.1 hypothetical protein [Klebsiella pneumoniae]